MADPWQCPACKTWIAPGVTEHRCDPDGGVLAVVGAPAPTQPSASMSVTGPPHWFWGTTTTTGTTAVQVDVSPSSQEWWRSLKRYLDLGIVTVEDARRNLGPDPWGSGAA